MSNRSGIVLEREGNCSIILSENSSIVFTRDGLTKEKAQEIRQKWEAGEYDMLFG